MSSIWGEADTTPAAIEGALRGLLRERHENGQAHAPARALNLVAVVDRPWRGEIANRLDRVGRYHPSRTVIVATEPGWSTLDGRAAVMCEGNGELSPCRESIEVDVGPQHLPHLDSVVAPILLSDLPTVLWSPHGHPEAVDSLVGLADVVLIDSGDEPSPERAIDRAHDLDSKARVVDLAWVRGTVWRERIAAAFEPEPWRSLLDQVSAVTVRHRGDSAVAALLVVGWLASRLGWKCRSLVWFRDVYQGRQRGRRQHVDVRLEAAEDPGSGRLHEIILETASGPSAAFERVSAGLSAVLRLSPISVAAWTGLVAPRDEQALLGEGIRLALLGDRTYPPALSAARAMLRGPG